MINLKIDRSSFLSHPYLIPDEPLPIAVALLMGLQHAFNMVENFLTPPFVIFRFSVAPDDPDLQAYYVASLWHLYSDSSLQVSYPILREIIWSPALPWLWYFWRYWDQHCIPSYLWDCDQPTAQQRNRRNNRLREYVRKHHGLWIFEVFLSLIPAKSLRKIFPPHITSITVILVGITLTGVGIKYWGGGVVCADMIWKDHSHAVSANVTYPNPGPVCTNGVVQLYYGSPQFIGLGFSVMEMLILNEFFGSVFMKAIKRGMTAGG